MKKQILITGSSGFIAQALIPRLLTSGHKVICLIHRRTPQFHQESPNLKILNSINEIETVLTSQHTHKLDAVIHLAGASIGDRPWTHHRKQILQSSRLDTISKVHDALLKHSISCCHVLGASAIGFYGDGKDTILSETAPKGEGFAANLCQDIEHRIQQVADTCNAQWHALRIGVVLGQDGGILRQLAPAARLGLGSVMGNGEQWLSWIDREDLVNGIQHLITTLHTNDHISSGPINMTSPQPVQWNIFAESLASLYGKKSRIKIPRFCLAPLGEMKHLFLDSVRVIPKVLLANKFFFKTPDIQTSLQNCLKYC